MSLINLENIEDILGLSKPLTKLIEVIAEGTGTIYKPYLIKKTAKAKAYEIKLISSAISENQTLLETIKYDKERIKIKSSDKTKQEVSIIERTKERLLYQEYKRQMNIENITQFAIDDFQSEQFIDEKNVGNDWISRFFEIAQDISEEQMQLLWGKILAGKVRNPSLYSLRTLDFMRNLSSEEAQIFNKIAQFAVEYKNEFFLYRGMDTKLLYDYGVTFEEIALLEEIGILHMGRTTNYKYTPSKNRKSELFSFGNKKIRLVNTIDAEEYKIHIRLFTRVGNELLKILDLKSNDSYIHSFISDFKSENTIVEIIEN